MRSGDLKVDIATFSSRQSETMLFDVGRVTYTIIFRTKLLPEAQDGVFHDSQECIPSPTLVSIVESPG